MVLLRMDTWRTKPQLGSEPLGLTALSDYSGTTRVQPRVMVAHGWKTFCHGRLRHR